MKYSPYIAVIVAVGVILVGRISLDETSVIPLAARSSPVISEGVETIDLRALPKQFPPSEPIQIESERGCYPIQAISDPIALPLLESVKFSPRFSGEIKRDELTSTLDESVQPAQFTVHAETPAMKSRVKATPAMETPAMETPAMATPAMETRVMETRVMDNRSIQPVLVVSPATAQLASNHINYGKTLARKGATFSARNEFVNALMVVSQSFDMQAGCKEYTEALARGMRVLDEADDFFPDNGLSNIQTDVSAIVDTHLSRLLTKEQAAKLTRAEVLQTYYSYARSQLQRGCGTGQNWVASEAFYSLGRLHDLLGQANLASQSKDYAKSIVLHYSAMDACSSNFASANELAVLLATSGQLREARELLVRSVTINPQAESWQNLATVHDRIGEADMAALARNEAEMIRGSAEQSSSSRVIRWVDSLELESTPEFGTDFPGQSVAQSPNETQSTRNGNSPPARQSSNWVEKVKGIF